MPQPLVSVGLVTWNSSSHLPICLAALTRQQCQEFELIAVDNASVDGSAELVAQQFPAARIISNQTNTGFSYAHNQAISVSRGLYYLALNPDVFLQPDFLSRMVAAIQLEDRIGQVSGKLYRISDASEIGRSTILDSSGMFFTSNQRHFDRGAGETDSAAYAEVEYVFGVSGAAALYRKSALQDAAFEDECFDNAFFAYREDADLSWRLQLLGWQALYAPDARAYHLRALRNDAQRADIPAAVNMHSVKNRFLMRIKNQTWRNSLRFFLPVLWRDLMVVTYVLLFERSSLPAFGLVLKYLPEMRRKRRVIMSKRRVADSYIAGWFHRKAMPFHPGGSA